MKGLKEYSERLNKLVCMIKCKRAGNAKDLAIKLNVSERQIYNDINYLKVVYDAPIVFNHTQNSYIFTDDNFEINVLEIKQNK